MGNSFRRRKSNRLPDPSPELQEGDDQQPPRPELQEGDDQQPPRPELQGVDDQPAPRPELQGVDDQTALRPEVQGVYDQAALRPEVQEGDDQTVLRPELQEGHDPPYSRPEHEGDGKQRIGDGQQHGAKDNEVTAMEDERECTFSQTLTQKGIGPLVPLKESYLNPAIKANLEDIEAIYTEIFALCVDIDNLLTGFKQRLYYVDEIASISMCFEKLRSLVGQDETLELNKRDNIIMCIDIGKNADEDAKEAVTKFNLMLERCREFLAKQNKAKTEIPEKISAIEAESVQTQATLDAVDRAKKQFHSIQEWNKQIVEIIEDTKSASKQFWPVLPRSRLATGMM